MGANYFLMMTYLHLVVSYDQFSNELLCRIEQGSIAASLYDKLADRETIRSMIQSWEYRITRQLVLHLSEEEHVLIDKMNKDWNPELFANREGIVPSPF